jgi:Uma2 family endonuclease
MSVQAYQALGQLGLIPENTELLHGEVFQKMPKSPIHSYVTQALAEFIRQWISTGHSLRQEQPICCADSEPEPDLAVVNGSFRDYADSHPTTAELVVEICVTSHEYDRSKLRAYAGAGVKEVWLVLVPERQVQVFRAPSGEGYAESRLVSAGTLLQSDALPGFALDPEALFRR